MIESFMIKFDEKLVPFIKIKKKLLNKIMQNGKKKQSFFLYLYLKEKMFFLNKNVPQDNRYINLKRSISHNSKVRSFVILLNGKEITKIKEKIIINRSEVDIFFMINKILN